MFDRPGLVLSVYCNLVLSLCTQSEIIRMDCFLGYACVLSVFQIHALILGLLNDYLLIV